MSDTNGQVIFEDKAAYMAYTIDYAYSNYSFLPSTISFTGLEFDSDKTINILGSNQVSKIEGSVKESGQLLTNVDVVLKR